MTNNTQLPAELDAEILWDQHSALIGDGLDDLSYWSGRDVMKKEDFVKAITEYATKLLEAEQDKKFLAQIKEELNIEIDKSRALLEKVISRHEAGLLPDRFIYQEIKTFLDGK